MASSFARWPLISDADPRPRSSYLTLDRALAAGMANVSEVSAQGQVPELLFFNDAGLPVILLDGEELVGAKQNRIVNLTILAPAKQSIRIPVSCVEQGRWRPSAVQGMASAPRTLFARARAAKAEQVTTSLRCDSTAHSDQGTIWEHIRRKSASLGTSSETSAMSDVFEAHEEQLADYLKAFEVVPGAVGALFGVGDQVGLEVFDSSETFMALFSKVLRGYALDAIEVQKEAAVASETLTALLDRVRKSSCREYPGVGLGRSVRFSGEVSGGALVYDGRVLHLAAFAKLPGARGGEAPSGSGAEAPLPAGHVPPAR